MQNTKLPKNINKEGNNQKPTIRFKGFPCLSSFRTSQKSAKKTLADFRNDERF